MSDYKPDALGRLIRWARGLDDKILSGHPTTRDLRTIAHREGDVLHLGLDGAAVLLDGGWEIDWVLPSVNHTTAVYCYPVGLDRTDVVNLRPDNVNRMRKIRSLAGELLGLSLAEMQQLFESPEGLSVYAEAQQALDFLECLVQRAEMGLGPMTDDMTGDWAERWMRKHAENEQVW